MSKLVLVNQLIRNLEVATGTRFCSDLHCNSRSAHDTSDTCIYKLHRICYVYFDHSSRIWCRFLGPFWVYRTSE